MMMQDKRERSLGKPGQKSPRAKYHLLVNLDGIANGKMKNEEYEKKNIDTTDPITKNQRL